MSRALVSVVVPVYNEIETLDELHRQVTAVMAGGSDDFELVLVDDGSRDGSTQRIRDLAAADPHVVGIILSRNFGHEAAIAAGLREARGDAVIVMDADLQDSPEALPEMIALWRDGADVVYAVRKNRKENVVLRTAFSSFYRIAGRVTSVDLPRDAGPFSLMSRQAADALVAMPEHGRYFPGLRAFTGFNQVALPVERNERLAGETKYSFKNRTAGALNAILSFSRLPLRFVTALGFLVFVVSLIGFAVLLISRISGTEIAPGWFSIVSAILLALGLQMLTLGIVGEYVGKIYEEVRARPQFIVAQRWEKGEIAPPRSTDARRSQ
jgi:glycosyltransferase involved in cell wall biosynthesis